MKVVVSLTPETGVPVLTMRDQLSVFQGISNPNNWSGPFRGSPARWKASDGEVVLAAIKAAVDNPSSVLWAGFVLAQRISQSRLWRLKRAR